MRTPEIPGEPAAAGSGRGLRYGGGGSRSRRKRRKGKAVSMEGLPGLAGRLDNEEYHEQQRVRREEKLVRQAQQIASDQTREDKASM